MSRRELRRISADSFVTCRGPLCTDEGLSDVRKKKKKGGEVRPHFPLSQLTLTGGDTFIRREDLVFSRKAERKGEASLIVCCSGPPSMVACRKFARFSSVFLAPF